jgi:tetratricopeptide (TPR) repeat protein
MVAVAVLLMIAFVAIAWPGATRFDWALNGLAILSIAAAAALGLWLAASGLPNGYRRAASLYADGQVSAALEELQGLAEDASDFAGVHQLWAQIYRERGQYGRSLAASERLIALDSKLYYGHAEKGLTLLAQGQPSQALEPLREAVSAAPYLPEAYYNLGMAAVEAADDGAVVEAMSRALSLGLRDQVTALIARYQLQQALVRLGDDDSAAIELRRLRRRKGALRAWRASLADEDLAPGRRRGDMALSARIERLIHS